MGEVHENIIIYDITSSNHLTFLVLDIQNKQLYYDLKFVLTFENKDGNVST